MQVKYCEDHHIYNMVYIEPKFVSDTLVKNKSITMEDYIVQLYWAWQKMEYIFLPYNFKYIFNYTIVLYYVSLSVFYNLWLIDYNGICVGFTGSFLSLI
jgi:hypothetical protein